MKKFGIFLLLVVFMLCFVLPVYAAPKISFDGKSVFSQASVINENGHIFVPLFDIAEALGASVEIEGNTYIVTKENKVVTFKTVKIVKDIVMVPLRLVAEKLGADVNWDGNTNTASIKSNVVLSEGSCDLDDGVYNGQMKDGKPYGAGIVMYKDGSTLEAEWRHGNPCTGVWISWKYTPNK